jgi:hypothetical protein
MLAVIMHIKSDSALRGKACQGNGVGCLNGMGGAPRNNHGVVDDVGIIVYLTSSEQRST